MNIKDKYKNNLPTKDIIIKYISPYITHCKKNMSLAKESLYLEVKVLEAFNKYLYYYNEDILLSDINSNHIEAYKQFCYEDLKNNNKTVNAKIKTLKRFFQYLTDYWKLYPYNFVLNVKHLRNEEEKKPTIISHSDLIILLNYLRDLHYGIRDVCISKLILQTGMTMKDVFSLEVSNLNLNERSLFIVKNKKIKVFSISNNLKKDLIDYMELRKLIPNNPNCNNLLFLANNGSAYYSRMYQLRFKEAILNTNLPVNLTPRNLRSTFIYNATKIAREEELQDILGQSKVSHYYKLENSPLNNLI